MQTTHQFEDFQKFIYAVEYEDFASIDRTNAASQSLILGYFVKLLNFYLSMYRNESVPVRFHPEFFHLPRTEKFFSQLFASLDLSLRPQVEEVFQQCWAFLANYIGPREAIPVMHRLIGKLKERFPHLGEMHNNAIVAITTEFFQPTIGEFLNQHKEAVTHLKNAFPAIYELFVVPIDRAPFTEHKLCNFYCNPWIYHRIANYLAYYIRLSSPEIHRELLEKPMEHLEESLQTIRSQANDESWQELTRKAHKLSNASHNLEPFAIESSGLLGEIRSASQFIKTQCHPKDVLVFLPEQTKKGKNCDLMVIRYKTSDDELIECKAKSPRHGLDFKTAGNAQIWDDFFTNFTNALSSYLHYLQETSQPILGLKLAKCFPLFFAFEGSSYGIALPLINGVLQHPTVCNVPLNEWSSEQKLTHLLRALFLSPLILEPCCVQLPSDDERLTQRQQATKEALQKEWVNTLLEKATEQLEKTYQRQKAEGHQISKMYVALDLDLSYRLQHDPLSYHDGNIGEIAAQTLHEVFRPFKDAFATRGLDLDLLILLP